ncbi:MAG: DUF5666 domain-containing protein [Acidimicrobiales bacterium]
MSGTDSITNQPALPEEPVTQEIMISPTQSVPVSKSPDGQSQSPVGTLVFDPSSEAEDWPARGPAKGIRMAWPVAVLFVLLIAGGGIWGGAALQRSQGSTTGASSIASALASRFAGARGSTGARSFGSGSTAAATGTVTEIQGSTLYVTNASGNLVEVKVNPSTTVTRNAKTKLSGLAPGDTVVVEGTTAKNGTVTAASVAATAEGVTAGFGGFG